nr:hypothetical protein CFP56_09116 [Quercus suber]
MGARCVVMLEKWAALCVCSGRQWEDRASNTIVHARDRVLVRPRSCRIAAVDANDLPRRSQRAVGDGSRKRNCDRSYTLPGEAFASLYGVVKVEVAFAVHRDWEVGVQVMVMEGHEPCCIGLVTHS